ncbi:MULTISPECIES: phosphodiesterase [Terrabacteria group]|uniref:phosphodiesterase n=1 Tax=Bacillati TaxID=1783272 RepID=UPI001C6E1543|nr:MULTISPECIES: phosphodiesterase [Terrabacteria group]MBW9212216.1 phosphodiesterase [Trueperella sp. zg.1013]
MKTYLVASDIHGSLDACKKVMDAYHFHQVDGILLLGDLLYHGPRNHLPKDYQPKEVIQLLNTYQKEIICVRGNCDSEVDQMVLNFPITADYSFFQLGNKRCFLSHGHIYEPKSYSFLKKGDLFLSGHTHIPSVNLKEDIYFLNPGSVAIPKGNHLATYALLTEEYFQTYTFDHQAYSISCIFKAG